MELIGQERSLLDGVRACRGPLSVRHRPCTKARSRRSKRRIASQQRHRTPPIATAWLGAATQGGPARCAGPADGGRAQGAYRPGSLTTRSTAHGAGGIADRPRRRRKPQPRQEIAEQAGEARTHRFSDPRQRQTADPASGARAACACYQRAIDIARPLGLRWPVAPATPAWPKPARPRAWSRRRRMTGASCSTSWAEAAALWLKRPSRRYRQLPIVPTMILADFYLRAHQTEHASTMSARSRRWSC